MKKPIFFICVAMFISWQVTAQRLISPTSGASHLKTLHRNTKIEADELPFDESLKPFYHGVASGDPLAHQVIIWTRVTPDDQTTATDIAVKWMIATDTKMTQIVQEGEFMTHADRDYTVKIDVTGLNEGTTYYYQFEALGKKSSIGRTKTTPTNTNHVKFAVVSCQNYEGGYFNAYAGIAAQNDLDAVIHLGDYIYEYGKGVYGADSIERTHIPDAEILNLADYRTRYSLYRLDPNLRRTHQQHPFIAIWDDHETANDSYKDGAENHNDGEGNWETRKNIAKKVYAEWMPIRGEANSIYRTIQYGNLLDLVMIDTRIEGREQQINDVTNPALYAPDRTLLGQTQKNWFLEQLQNSQAKWKIIGNQIIFSEFHVGWASLGAPSLGTPEQLESTFLDIWDGYPAERDIIIDYLTDNQINNVVWLTGDFHCAFAFDVAKRPSAFSSETPNYNPETGAGAVAVEFATPSISSANFNENLDAFTALALQFQINKPLSAAGTPFDGVNKRWETLYFNFLEQIWAHNHNPNHAQKKYVFFICYSYQMMCRFFNLATVSERNSTSFGIYKIHKTLAGHQDPILKDLPDPYFAVDSRDWQLIHPDYHTINEIGAKILSIEKIRLHRDYERALMALRISDELVGTQFHPEAEPVSMAEYFGKEEKRRDIIKIYGEEKYRKMMVRMDDPNKIAMTHQTILPNFLRNATTNLLFKGKIAA